MSQTKIKVLFVCMGNICRSPTAEGIFRKLILEKNLEQFFEIDSAGTHSYHIGSSPDSRTQVEAKKHNVDLSNLRARQVCDLDLNIMTTLLQWIHRTTMTLCLNVPERIKRRFQ